MQRYKQRQRAYAYPGSPCVINCTLEPGRGWKDSGRLAQHFTPFAHQLTTKGKLRALWTI